MKYNDTTFPELESNWRATVFYRLNDIKNSHSTTEILNKWKKYKVPYGHKLARNLKHIVLLIPIIHKSIF